MKRLEIKHTNRNEEPLGKHISRLNTVKERTNEHEDRSTEITQCETQSKKRENKIDQSIQDCGLDNKYFLLVGHTIFIATTQLCYYSTKAAIDSTETPV